MHNVEVLLESLKNQHESFKNNEITLESVINDITNYELFIPEFFSKTGEAEGIRKMYSAIKESMEEEKSIMCIDVSNSASIYNEYMEGMSKFIIDMAEVNSDTDNTNDLVTFKENFNKAKQNDSIFIESLYEGKIKENEKVETPLSTAVSNVEFLIDFIPQLSILKESCTNICNTIKSNTDPNYTELLNDGMKMLFESVDQYC